MWDPWDGRWSRRELLARTLAAAGVLTLGERGLVAVRRGLEIAAEALLQAQGFSHVEYVRTKTPIERTRLLAGGQIDVTMALAPVFVTNVDAGDPVVTLGGVHVGCYELFGNERVRTVRDLKGKTVGFQALGSPEHLYLSSMAAYVGSSTP